MPEKYAKVWWASRHGQTAGLIFPESQLRNLTLPELSRAWPNYEASKMHKLHRSPWFQSWEAAFQFEIEENSHTTNMI